MKKLFIILLLFTTSCHDYQSADMYKKKDKTKTEVIEIVPEVIVETIDSVALSPQELPVEETPIADLPGFFSGLWHGFWFWIYVILWVFTDDTYVYQTPNSGPSYLVGFIIGLLFLSGGSSKK